METCCRTNSRRTPRSQFGRAASGRHLLVLTGAVLLLYAATASAGPFEVRFDEFLAATAAANSQHNYPRAAAFADSAIRESERQGAYFLGAVAYGIKVSALLAGGQLKLVDSVERDLSQRLDQAIAVSFTSATVRLSLCLASLYSAKSDQDKSAAASAERLLKDAVARASGPEYSSARAGAYWVLGGIALGAPDFLLAEHYLRKSVQEADASRDYFVAGLARLALSNAILHTAPEEALRNMLAACALFDSCGAVQQQIAARAYLVQSYRLAKDTTRALASAARYRDMVVATGRSEMLPDVWRTMAQVDMDAGLCTEADSCLRLELGLRKRSPDSVQLARCLEDLSVVHWRIGDTRGSIEYANEAIRTYRNTRRTSESVMMADFIWPCLDAEHDTAGLKAMISYIEQCLDSIKGLDNLHRVLLGLALYYSSCSEPRSPDKAVRYLLRGLALTDSMSERRIDYLTRLAGECVLSHTLAERAVYLEEACRVAKRIGSNQLGSIYADLSGAVALAENDTFHQRVYAESAQAWFAARHDTTGLIQTLKALASVGWPNPTVSEYGYAMELLEHSLALGDHSSADRAYMYISQFLRNSAQNIAAFRIDSAWWSLAVRDSRGRDIPTAGLYCLRSGKASGRITAELKRLILTSIEQAIAESTNVDRITELADYYGEDAGDTSKALQLYERAIAAWGSKSLSNPFKGYAELLIARGRTQEGLTLLLHSVDIDLRQGQLELAAFGYERVARLYNDLKDCKSAVLFGEKAIGVWDQLVLQRGNSDIVRMRASALGFLADYYASLGETEKAVDLATQSARDAPGGKDLVPAAVTLAITLVRSGRLDAAELVAKRVVESCREPSVKIILASLMYEFAWARCDTASMNDWRRTIPANVIADSITAINPPMMLCTKAMQSYFRSDLAACSRQFDSAKTILYRRQPVDWDALASVYKTSTMRHAYSGEWRRALELLDSAFCCIDRNYAALRSVEAIRGYTASASASLPMLALLVVRIYQEDRDLSVIRHFVDVTEKVCARSFLAAMAGSTGETAHGATVEASILSARMAAITSELAVDLRDDTRQALLKERDAVYSELTALDRRNVGEDTGAHATAAIVPVGVQTVMRDGLRDNQMALRFYLFPQSCFAFAFTRDSFWVYQIPAEEILAVRIKTLKNYYKAYRPGNAGAEAYMLRTQSHTLYKLLLGPLGDRIAGKELVIIPDRVLYYLPFEMLVSDTARTPGRPNGIEYLCEANRVIYAPSLSVYYHLANRRPTRGSAVLAIGKGNFSHKAAQRNDSIVAARGITDLSYGIADLRYAEGEAADVYNVFSGASEAQGTKSRLMLGAEASETSFKANAIDGYTYVHFTTHGLVDDDNPDYSALLLDEVTSASGREDGVLHAFEIAKLNLNADLVVLSACNTGLGRLWSGDGMIGLNWAFLAAGARTLCVTLWSIDDKSTSVFMRHFYQLLLGGKPPAEALQETRVFMLRETEYRSPYYWAPFVLFGAS